MGHTHYWRHAEFSQVSWDAFTDDVRVLLSVPGSLTDVQREGEDTGRPAVNGNYVSFNGKGEDAHETFHFTRETEHSFCKTYFMRPKPYDRVVCAVLLLAKHHFGDALEVTSDGNWDEWAPGRGTLVAVMGITARPSWIEEVPGFVAPPDPVVDAIREQTEAGKARARLRVVPTEPERYADRAPASAWIPTRERPTPPAPRPEPVSTGDSATERALATLRNLMPKQ